MSENVTSAADDVRSDLEAVLAEAEKSAPPEKPAPPPPRAPPVEHEEEAAERLVPPERDRPRDQFGRFLKADATAEVPAEEAAAPAEEETADQPETVAMEPAPSPSAQPPRSWSDAAKSAWASAPPAIQEAVLKRETEMSRGAEQWAEQINGLQPIAQVIQPYSQKFALRGVNPAAAVQQLLAVQDLLERDPLEGVAYVARSYGVDLRSFAAALQQTQQPQDPQVQAANSRIERVEQFLQQQQAAQQQHEMARIGQEIEAFRADTGAHPYFEHVRPRMAELMQVGAARSLAHAYRLACAERDDISAAIAQAAKTTEQASRVSAEKQAAERARRAGVSVAGVPSSGKAAAAPKDESVRDTLERVLEQTASR